jgi:hypothetical protein
MSTKKNPGLGARKGSVEAALAASRITSPAAAAAPEASAPVVPLSVRLPKAMHEVLRKIAFDRRVSIHSLILEGIEKVIAEKR